MNSFLKYSFLVLAAINLTACSSMYSSQGGMQTAGMQPSELQPGVTQSGPIGGKIELSMDENDKQKLSRAMDSAIGKSTTWVNGGSGISFTVMPTKKITIGSNKFCRQYNVKMQKNTQTDQVNGTACIAEDGAWHPA